MQILSSLETAGIICCEDDVFLGQLFASRHAALPYY